MSSSPELIENKAEPVTPQKSNETQHSSMAPKVALFNRYQLWPRSYKALSSSPPRQEPFMDPNLGRSPSSMSDTAVNRENLGFWTRGSSLSRRRKISVPELRKKPMSVTHGNILDSPTIPGRPPLRTVSSDLAHHERSVSASGDHWQNCAFGDAMIACVSGPTFEGSLPSPRSTSPVGFLQSDWTSFNQTRPLSPIFSPPESTTPTSNLAMEIPPELPPKVPPKPAAVDVTPTKVVIRRSPSKSSICLSPSKPQHQKPTPLASVTVAVSIPQKSSPSPTKSSGRISPGRISPGRISPGQKSPTRSSKALVAIPPDVPVMQRGHPSRRSQRKRNGVLHSRENSGDFGELPSGLRPIEAMLILPESEKSILHKQATSQAEKFEILGTQEVGSLSQELSALDERCEYLRKTYKSLRAGRQRLQSRMIFYLRKESLTFSKERLLKQEEILVELDKSIDDWTVKLEHAENRRLRIHQKLLEHVAAAMTLNMAANVPRSEVEVTPPGSPQRTDSPQPLRVDRKDVESIKIYADNQVLNLFTEIEQAIGRMCEAC